MTPLVVTDDDGRRWAVEVDERGTWRQLVLLDDAPDEVDGDPMGYRRARGAIKGTEPAEIAIRRLRGEDPSTPDEAEGSA